MSAGQMTFLGHIDRLSGPGAVALLALGRALRLLVGSDLLELVTPLAFVVLVAVLSTLMLVHRSPLGRP